MKRLILRRAQLYEMEFHVRQCAPDEGCGLLAGIGDKVELTIPITNQLHSPVRYNMEPNELVRAFYDFEARGLELLASFHSHPNGPTVPSETDLCEYAYPEAGMLIWSVVNGQWVVNGFEISGEKFAEIALQITE